MCCDCLGLAIVDIGKNGALLQQYAQGCELAGIDTRGDGMKRGFGIDYAEGDEHLGLLWLLAQISSPFSFMTAARRDRGAGRI